VAAVVFESSGVEAACDITLLVRDCMPDEISSNDTTADERKKKQSFHDGMRKASGSSSAMVLVTGLPWWRKMISARSFACENSAMT
jgi:hypothetical protein